MNTSFPLVSVVIPTYNQSRFLVSAIQSVLTQTYRDYEIILVDDGSTDDTPTICAEYSSEIRYIRQNNQGLAGARNTGICHARGQFVALLDSDDVWLPFFLDVMMTLAIQNPFATVYYSGWRYIDTDGKVLPQSPHTWVIPANVFYKTLLRANFIIPSTVIMQRTHIIEAGLFDPIFRRLQDWELWLRLLRTGHKFVGSDACLVYYRLHPYALSLDPAGGQRSALAMVNKLFGLEDGQPHTWSQEKRLAYGGVYRYCTLTSVQRQGNWHTAASYLRHALQVDPTLSTDLDLFYDLAHGNQPAGYRGKAYQLDLENNAKQIYKMLNEVFGWPETPNLENSRRRTLGTANYALGLVAYNIGKRVLCRKFFLSALAYRPELWLDQRVVGNIFKSLVSRSIAERINRFKKLTHSENSIPSVH